MGFVGFWGFWGGVTACRSRSVAHLPLAAVRHGGVGFTSTRGGTQLECVTGSVVCTIRRGNDWASDIT